MTAKFRRQLARWLFLASIATALELSFAWPASALTADQLQALTNAVVEMCETPTRTGERFTVEGAASGGFIFRLAGGELEAKISRETWNGIRQIAETQPATQPARVQCATQIVAILAPMMQTAAPPGPAASADPGEILSRANTRLAANKAGDFDLDARLAGISDLRVLATRNVDLRIWQIAVDVLTNYIRTNLPDRKRFAPELGIEEDRGMYRAEDIHQALQALQELRQASKGELQIKLSGIDFDRVTLAYADLSGFDLSYSTFRRGALGPNLRDVNFSFATFENTAIWNADLSDSNFHKAQMAGIKLMNPELANTNIEEAFGLAQMQIFCRPIGLTSSQARAMPADRC